MSFSARTVWVNNFAYRKVIKIVTVMQIVIFYIYRVYQKNSYIKESSALST